MMKQLHLEEGDLVNIEYVKLPRATFAKFKPKAKEFLDISNPR
jgi:Ubiquitin fusion degradation protein UFD1